MTLLPRKTNFEKDWIQQFVFMLSISKYEKLGIINVQYSTKQQKSTNIENRHIASTLK
jgi:hypothetical protein